VVGDGGGAPNRFDGVVSRDRFLGAVRRYDLTIGESIICGETGFRGPIDAVSIRPEHVRLLPE